MEDVYTEDVFDLDHGNHKICRDCATVYLNNALKDKSVPIKCPFDRCTHIISEPKCFEVLGEELYDEFFDLSCRPHGDPGFRQCPVLNCKGFDLLDDVNTGDCYCFICERHWCCNCHVDLVSPYLKLSYHTSNLMGGFHRIASSLCRNNLSTRI